MDGDLIDQPTTALKVNPSAVTHRLARYAKRTTEQVATSEGAESTRTTEVEWDAVCACGRVFTAPTEKDVSAKYLNHLPKPKG